MRPAGALDDLGGLLHHLEDHLAEPEEGLARRSRRSRPLADAAQVEPGRLERAHAAVEIWGHRHDVVDRAHSVGVLG